MVGSLYSVHLFLLPFKFDGKIRICMGVCGGGGEICDIMHLNGLNSFDVLWCSVYKLIFILQLPFLVCAST